MKIVILLLALAAIGIAVFIFLRSKQPLSASQNQSVPVTGITVKDVSADVPQFKREYLADINGRRLKVTIKNFGRSLGLYKTGELTQSNGRWIFFDPDAVADKIIDRELAPLVEQRCREIDQLDAAFREGNPSEFTDESGTIWKRVQK